MYMESYTSMGQWPSLHSSVFIRALSSGRSDRHRYLDLDGSEFPEMGGEVTELLAVSYGKTKENMRKHRKT